MSPIVLVFVGLGIHYLVLGRFPILVLDHIGVTYRAYEDPVTLLRRGPVVWLRWDEIQHRDRAVAERPFPHDPVEPNATASTMAASAWRK